MQKFWHENGRRLFWGGLISYILPEDKILQGVWPGCIIGMSTPDPSSAFTIHPQKCLKL